jgi:5-methylcytosine-specific restriction protein A
MEQNLLFDATDWQDKEITLHHYGRGPKKLGDGVYKFGAALSLPVILPKRGWTLVNKARSYVYLKPPEAVKPPFRITVKVPNEEQAKAIFTSLFERGKSWAGRIGEWPAIYLHNRQGHAYMLENDPQTGVVTEKLASTFNIPASLSLGEHGAWKISIESRNGEINYIEYKESIDY